MEVSRGNDDGVNVVALIKFVVVATKGYVPSGALLQESLALLPALTPEIGESRDLEVEFAGKCLEGREMAVFETIGKTNQPHPHPVVRAQDSRMTFCSEA